jgi:GTPase SAR1 family protein
MTNQQISSALVPLLASLQGLLSQFENPAASARLDELMRDIESGFYSVVLLGEFNRGKSTLLNALLGRDLLPVDILPTTAAIHVVRYSPSSMLRAHYHGGTVEDLELTKDTLGRFVSVENAARVEYLEIGLPEPVLSGGMVFIDTPGVDDLNRQRAEITFQFVPRPDAVIFVLDATAALRRTEADFLESSILASGIKRLIFVANFADRLEPEDEAEVIQSIKNRLAAALGPGERTVVLVSARQALRSRAQGLDDHWKASGFADLINAIEKLKTDGTAGVIKANGRVRRALGICSQVQCELERLIEVNQASDSELQEQQTALVRIDQDAQCRRSRIAEWAEDREREILAMVAKSLGSFGVELEQQIRDAIADYRQADFAQFVEKIPFQVKRSLKRWLDSHESAIASLLEQVRLEVTRALSQQFQKQFVLASHVQSFRFEPNVEFSVAGDDVSVRTQAGLIAGSLMAILSLAGFGALGPLVAFAGLHHVHDKLFEHKLNAAKAKLQPEVSRAVRQTVNDFIASVMDALRSEIRNICLAAEEVYDKEVKRQQQRVAEQLEQRRSDQSRLERKTAAFRDVHGRNAIIGRDLQTLMDSIQSEQTAA